MCCYQCPLISVCLNKAFCPPSTLMTDTSTHHPLLHGRILPPLRARLLFLARLPQDWERKYNQQVRKRKRLEAELREAKETIGLRRMVIGPDDIEGPTSGFT